ncbi:MAG: class I SAM-dependent methyltransferase [Anaerolineae bacterium]|jgi:SAM-dependent methyltransferase|nr:class I SAM-dependent methyltransferase [Anaerolineae bacterium]
MPAPRRPSLYQRAFARVYGWATLRLYDELAWAYDPISRWVSGGRWDAWRRMALDYLTGPRVLEVGFGTGELLIELRERGYEVTGIDASRAMQRVAGRKLRARSCAIPRLLGSAAALPFAARVFDSIVSTFPAGYILEVASLRELARVLRPGGILVIAGLAVELPTSLRFPLSIAPGEWAPLWEYFVRAAGEAGLRADVSWRADGPARVPVIVATHQLAELGDAGLS